MSEKLNIDKMIEEIDKDIEVFEMRIEKGEALSRLLDNKDFQIVITEGYLKVEADRVFGLLTHPLTIKPEDKSNYLSQLDTIKNLSRYLGSSGYKGTVKILAENAKKDKELLIQQKQELIAGKGE